MGRHIQVICISEYTVKVPFVIKNPRFIKGKGQSVVYIIVHEFQPSIFEHFIYWKNITLLEKWLSMVSIASKGYNSYSFFLLNSQLLEIGGICTAIDVNTIRKMGMDHCIVQLLQGVPVDEIFDSINAKQ
jgi:hypothetical protein